MRRLGSLILAVLVVTGLVAAEASAGTIALDYDTTNFSKYFSSLGAGGGEFAVTTFSSTGVSLHSPLGDSNSEVRYHYSTGYSAFQTFCLERNEYFYEGTTYTWMLNTGAVYGGLGGDVNGFDPLDPKTAWLYTKFWEGTLDSYGYDYDFGTDRVASAGALQEAIWYIEGELPSDWSLSTQAQAFYNAASNSGWTDTGKVYVLNLRNADTGAAIQDQLIIVDSFTPENFVPLPAAAYMGGMLMAGIFAISRVRRRRKA